jgi:hypothetical protein
MVASASSHPEDRTLLTQESIARVVEAAATSGLPYVLVPIAALKGWQARDPDAWRKVEAWLVARGKTVVEV